MSNQASTNSAPSIAPGEERFGMLLVFLAALAWSLGGAIARFIEADDSWTVVFWRSLWASASILVFMLWRDGLRGSLALFRGMGAPGVAVAICFAIASSCFVVALAHTTVANILLMQAGVPLYAALIAFFAFGERVSGATWLAILAVFAGVAVMVSDNFSGAVSPIGDGLALTIALVFSVATVITRRYAHVRMTPAMCLGTAIAGCAALTQASTLVVTASDMSLLFAFGAINLGLGLALFATGARLIPAAWAALLANFETLLGPVWVWLVHGETPSTRTLIGGGVVFAALLVHTALEFRRNARPAKPGMTGQAPL